MCSKQHHKVNPRTTRQELTANAEYYKEEFSRSGKGAEDQAYGGSGGTDHADSPEPELHRERTCQRTHQIPQQKVRIEDPGCGGRRHAQVQQEGREKDRETKGHPGQRYLEEYRVQRNIFSSQYLVRPGINI